MQHSRYSPSDSARWLNCAGAIPLEESLALAEEGENFFADEGSAAHNLGEMALLKQKEPEDFIGEKILIGKRYWEVDSEMARHVKRYTDHVREHAYDPTYIQVEAKIDLTFLADNMFGHVDALVYEPEEKRLNIMDLKYGQGILVEADENTQLMLYALGALKEFQKFHEDSAITTIRLHIIQPRGRHPMGPIRWWDLTPEDLADFQVRVSTAIGLIKDHTTMLPAKRTPGDKQCRWCDARSVCPELASFVVQTAQEEFADFLPNDMPPSDSVEPDSIPHLSKEQMNYLLLQVPTIKVWVNAIETACQEILEKGGKLDDFKLVRGRSIRRWDDATIMPDILAEYGIEAPYTKKLLSPTQAEKLLDKDGRISLNEEYVVKPEGKITIARATDKRAAVRAPNQAADEFAEFN